MKLFVSYSRDDKQWVYDFWRSIRERLREEADCFIMVLTPRSLESIYCMAELDYALALNKPILPLMLKPCGENQPADETAVAARLGRALSRGGIPRHPLAVRRFDLYLFTYA